MWRADEKGCSSSYSLEGDQGKEGKFDISIFLLFSVTIICCHHELFCFHRLILGSASGAGGCASVWHVRTA